MTKKKKIIIGAALCLVAAAVILAAAAAGRRGKKGSEEGSAQTSEQGVGSESSSETGEKETAQNQDKGDSSREDAGDGTAAGTPDASGENGSAGAGGTAGGNPETQGTDPGNDGTGDPVAFPYTVAGTTLTIQDVSSYDGIFIEDGSDQEVSGVAAMVLTNTGDANVEYASITLTGDGEELQFDASAIPAGATVVVQEKNRAPYGSGTFTQCSGMAAELETFEMSENKVKVEETEDGSLQVTNLTGEELPCVRIFYKFYMEEEDCYVGGIAYTAKLTHLAGGSSQTVTPSHYVSGSSRILMVRTYDTAE